MTDLTARLQEIRATLAAATPGPWRTESVEDGRFAGVESRVYSLWGSHILLSPTDGEAGQAKTADAAFIASAPVTVARLLAAVEVVVGLHRETSQDFITGTDCAREECEHEDGCPVEPLPVCHHCWGQLEQIDPYWGEDHHVSEVMWPCPTITALTAALGDER